MTEIFALLWEFFKTGLFAVGGGLATLPFLHDMIGRYNWFSESDLANMIAVAESTPGPIGVNMATFAGYNAAGIPGGILATLALVLPSIIVIILVTRFLDRFKENKLVSDAFEGLRPAVAALVLAAGFSVFKISVLSLDLFASSGRLIDAVNLPALVLFVLFFLAMKLWKKLPPLVFIALGAVAGLLFKL